MFGTDHKEESLEGIFLRWNRTDLEQNCECLISYSKRRQDVSLPRGFHNMADEKDNKTSK